jgi:asparagine synthase (glutamine-hydrolysing)
MSAVTAGANARPDSSAGLAAWTARLTGARSAQATRDGHMIGRGNDFALLTSVGKSAIGPATASNQRFAVLFDGLLYNRAALEPLLADRRAAHEPRNDAQIILELFARFGADCLARIRGVFAILLFDFQSNSLWAARDPLGVYPLYYARCGHDFVFSTSVDAVLQQPGVSRHVNRPALADFLCNRWPRTEETYFESVFRVPQGHVLKHSASATQCHRYWDPAPVGQPVKWITEEETSEFGPLFSRAVERCMSFGPTGIFLSGGLDSVSVAAAAVDIANRTHMPRPLALSLAFPDPECNEEQTQRSVAKQLNLSLEMLPFYEAAGPDGLLSRALDLSATLPAPIMNTWFPAYLELAKLGCAQGCQTILTGGGGDEWLSVSPTFAADLMRRGDFVGLSRLMINILSSYRLPRLAMFRTTMWRFGLRTLGAHAVRAAMMSWTPGWYEARRRRSWQRCTPDWVAPRAELRRQMQARFLEQAPPAAPDGFYLEAVRTGIEHSVMSLEFEEIYEFSGRIGARILQPFWDADLVDFLYRTPPQLLNRSGRHKSLLREFLSQRCPRLDFERHKKLAATSFYRAILDRERSSIHRRLGQPTALAELGIVDAAKTERFLKDTVTGRGALEMHKIWRILNLEAWLRPRL